MEGFWTPVAGRNPIRLATAFYDRGRCLPWAMATECIVREEWCPTSPKAIYLLNEETTGSAGGSKAVRRPYLDPQRCVGCGACQFACPVQDRPAVYVTSIGESRAKANVMRSLPVQSKVLPKTGEAAWKKTRDTRTFEAATLWQHIDGDAERYLAAGVRKTFTAE